VAYPPVEKPIRVLVVEAADHEYSPILHEILEEVNAGQFEATRANDLNQALENLDRISFDVVLLDLRLPDSNGLDTYSQVSARAPDVPIVVADSFDNKPLALEILREGAQDYLIKGDTNANHLRRSLLYAIERHRARVVLQQLTFNDDLTGLLNRRGFLSLAQQQMKIAQRENWELIVLFADLDGLKNINDTFGHPEGDRALRAVAMILKETFRTSDLVARLGGDEFIVLAINAPAPGVKAITTRLEENVDRYNAHIRYYQLSLSFGVVQFDPQRDSALEDVIIKADKALYENKRRKLKLKT
jgi:diguanylate cyclase (GGDEF)-like protein